MCFIFFWVASFSCSLMIIYNIVKIFNKKVFKNNLNEKLKLVRTMKKKKKSRKFKIVFGIKRFKYAFISIE